ncbi:hypothetical protein PF008_g26616 [Phytophthora fragariae]|uniref:Uncharacterized protein n=1 Tax=Phytophthora fragariae TaxID=53985 RepID=A0A6G0QGI3_9STRA|nr:hypothetical protein PF008_g26616 [Phytophthora fragariae]
MERGSELQPQATSARDNDPNKDHADANINTKTTPRSVDGAQSQHVVQADDADDRYRRAFSSYSFSNSSVVDDKGRRVTSTRRRYEDSTGRLKAVHERQIEGHKLRTTWNRVSPDDEGQIEAVCSTGTPEEFETLWQQTPFGEAQKKTIKQQQLSYPVSGLRAHSTRRKTKFKLNLSCQQRAPERRPACRAVFVSKLTI